MASPLRARRLRNAPASPFRFLLGAAALVALPCLLAPAGAQQSFRVEVYNTRQEITGQVWQGAGWVAFCRDEDEKSLNGDTDTDDTVVGLFNTKSLTTVPLGIAIDPAISDDDEDWPIAFSSSGDWMALQVSEADNGERDLNGNGRAEDSVLHLYNLNSRQFTNLNLVGSAPRFVGNRLLFTQREASIRADLNNDKDMGDNVLCSYDLATKQVESLGMECELGYEVAGDWIATLTREAGQGNKDLNGDKDTQDEVVQVYQLSQKKWSSTGLEGSFGYTLTAKLVAVGVEEAKQGNQDLNGDNDAKDIVAHAWDLAKGGVTNLATDCSGDLVADDNVVGLMTNEESQGNRDLNGDKDTQDDVVQVWTLGATQPVNLARDGSGGIAAGGGKILFACAEVAQGERDLNGDKDSADYVLMLYVPQTNKILNAQLAVDGDVTVGEGYAAWKVLEADQGNRDLNRDQDTDDSILYVMELSTNQLTTTSHACGDTVDVSGSCVAFITPESDQGNRDLNMDRDAEDEVLQVARYRK